MIAWSSAVVVMDNDIRRRPSAAAEGCPLSAAGKPLDQDRATVAERTPADHREADEGEGWTHLPGHRRMCRFGVAAPA